jgi:hypothetical protein
MKPLITHAKLEFYLCDRANISLSSGRKFFVSGKTHSHSIQDNFHWIFLEFKKYNIGFVASTRDFRIELFIWNQQK